MSTSTLSLIDVVRSTSVRCKPYGIALRVSLALTALHLVTACSDEKKDGGLAVVVESDLQLPKDFDGLRFEVSQDGKTLRSENFAVGTGDKALLMPAEFRVKPMGDTKKPVLIRALAIKGTTVRIERSVITTVPTDYLAFVRLPLTYLCAGMARDDGSSTCGDSQTCKLGACEPAEIDPKSLPVYLMGPWSDTDATRDASKNDCFDVVNCLAEASRVTVDRDSCTFRIEDEDPTNISVGIKLPRGSDGICGAGGCWIALDEGDEGWTHDGPLFMLPRALCLDAADGTRLTIVVSNTCVGKTLYTPPCGDWSSARKPADTSESIGITTSGVIETPGEPIGVSCAGLSFQACGDCGQQRRTCRNGVWSDWGECSGQGLCTPASSENCGTNGMRACLSTCDWDDCSGQTCVGPAVEACGSCGTRRRACENGQWAPWGACEAVGECMPGTTQACGAGGTQACMGNCQWGVCGMQACDGAPQQACGNCGTQSRECDAGTTTWSAFAACAQEGACEANQTRSCGLSGMQTCGGDCQWDGACTGQVCEGPASRPCGRCGIQTRTCDDTSGEWSDWSACSGQGMCEPGSFQSCGAGGRQLCLNSCEWSEECTDQECFGPMTQSCGFCGTQSHECNALTGEWLDWGACSNQGPCNPGATRRCGSNGTQACTASCQWSAVCSGQTCPGNNTEPCGNCGTQMLTCNGDTGQWVRTGGCMRQGTCAPGSFQSCGANKLHQCTDRCVYGDCNICAQGTRECDNACVDSQTDPFNCGRCGNSCDGLACNGGNCATCPSGRHNCNGDCRSNTDPASCGDSCTPCTAPANGTATCTASRCDWQCNPGYHRCGDAFQCFSNNAPGFCGDRCNVDCSPPSGGRATCESASCVAYCGDLRVDVKTDANNCGACGVRCASGAPCVNGACMNVDECALGTDDCDPNATCTDTAVSFTCKCFDGYSGDGRTCQRTDECATNPCGTSSTCTNTTPGNYSCRCQTGYESPNDRNCTRTDQCAMNPCGTNSTCTNTTPGDFQCKCDTGYSSANDRNCTRTDECAAKPCGNNSVCTNTTPGNHSCACESGYSGANGLNCTRTDECAGNPCGNNSICTNTTPGNHSCACESGYSGPNGMNCARTDECAGNPCGSNSICMNTTPGNHSCACESGYSGPNGMNCTAVDACAGNPCGNNSICMNTTPGNHSCTCESGYSGVNGMNCTRTDDCAGNPCGNNSICMNTTPGNHSCTCESGYSGANGMNCARTDDCAGNPCGSNSICMNTTPGNHSCTCESGYSGANGMNCTRTDECAGNPCGSNSICMNTTPGNHACACEPGYSGNNGMNCTPIDDCGGNPCGNNAICMNTSPGTHTCVCEPGYSGANGTNCTRTDECAGNPCGDNSVCANTTPGNHSCTCQPGYTGANGTNCMRTDECAGNPCGANSTCTNSTPGNYSCRCDEGYSGDEDGKNCKVVDRCASQPCGANSTCTNSTPPGSFSCRCDPGYSGNDSGMNCTPTNLCAGNPCGANSTCTNSTPPGSFSCRCDPGYSGNDNGMNCTATNLCAGNPCGDNSTCTNTTPGSFDCTCDPGFSGTNGRNCKAVDVNPCDPSPCSANAVCTPGASGQATCSCLAGFRTDIEAGCIDIDECADKTHDCDPNATCMNTQGSFSCTCNSGYTGDGRSCTMIILR